MKCIECNVEEGEFHIHGCTQQISTNEPFFNKVFSCERCGVIVKSGEWTVVSDEEWKKIIGVTYIDDVEFQCVLCKGCMKFIKEKREILEEVKNDI